MNQHYEDARSILSIRVPGDTLEGVVTMLEAQAEATLALAYAQETANLIAILSEGGPSIHVEDHLINKGYLPLMQQLKERLNLA